MRQVDYFHKMFLNHLREYRTQGCYEFMSPKCYHSSQFALRWKKIMDKVSTH